MYLQYSLFAAGAAELAPTKPGIATTAKAAAAISTFFIVVILRFVSTTRLPREGDGGFDGDGISEAAL
jgi:hypothetical protein